MSQTSIAAGPMDNLKTTAARGSVAKLGGQVVILLMRITSIVVLARLLTPADFGLFAMVWVLTAILDLIANSGFTMASVQTETINDSELSTMFWINIGLAAGLALFCAALGPALATFYNEPRVAWITPWFGLGIIVNAAASQHLALLQRQLRYVELTLIAVVASVGSAALGITMAWAGHGYWALVAAAIVSPAFTAVCAWSRVAWLPGPPAWSPKIGALLGFSATVMANNIVIFIAYNLEKVLLGRYWGVEQLGIYGRAVQLVNMPVTQLHSVLGGISFSALSRLQGEPERYRRYFLRIYTVAFTATASLTLFAGVFAEEIVRIALGPNWSAAAPVFRLLTPAVLFYAVVNPTAWLLQSAGLQQRSLWLALVIAPLCILAYMIGVPYGPNGVAASFSLVLTLWLVPHVLWCVHGTVIAPADLAGAAWRPLVAAGTGAVAAAAVKAYLGAAAAGSLWHSPYVLLVCGGLAMAVVHAWCLLVALGQRQFYADVLDSLMPGRFRPAA